MFDITFKKIKKIKLLCVLFSTLLVLSSLIFFTLAYYTHSTNLFYFFNSDSLYIPALYNDLFREGGSFWDWFLTPAPYFFPDMFLYAIAAVFHNSHYDAIATFGTLQILSTLVLSFFIFKNFFKNTFSLLLCALLSILIVPLVIQNLGAFKYLSFSAFHYGATLSALLCILISLWFLRLSSQKNNKAKKYFLLLMISIVAGISISSDKLFLLIFCLPVFLYWFYVAISMIKEISVSINILIRNSIISLVISIIWTALTGDKAIATEELLIGVLVGLILTFIFYYFQQKLKNQNKQITQFDCITIFLITSSIVSVIFTKIFVIHETEYLNLVFGFQKFSESLEIIRGFFGDLMKKDFLTFSLIIISILLGAFIISQQLILKSKASQKDKNALMKREATTLALISTGGSLVTIVVTCMNESWHVGDRYVINIFIIPLIAFFPLAQYFLSEFQRYNFFKKAQKFYVFAFVTLLIVTPSSRLAMVNDILQKTLSGAIYTEYYPSEVQCLDRAVQKYNLKEGISAYWHAKWVYILSQENLIMAQYDYNHKPMTWITSNGWYRDQYDFALIVTLKDYDPGYNLNREALIELNGEPEVVINCPVFDVLAYPARKLRIEPIEEL